MDKIIQNICPTFFDGRVYILQPLRVIRECDDSNGGCRSPCVAKTWITTKPWSWVRAELDILSPLAILGFGVRPNPVQAQAQAQGSWTRPGQFAADAVLGFHSVVWPELIWTSGLVRCFVLAESRNSDACHSKFYYVVSP